MLAAAAVAAAKGPPPEAMALLAVWMVFIVIAGLVGLFVWIFTIFCWWRLFSRTGSSGALALLLLVPFGGLIVLMIAAFGSWPVLDELRALRAQSGHPPR